MSRLAEATLPRFFQEAAREHSEAVALAGATDRDLRFADRRLRLCFAGRELADGLLAALAPRLASAGETADVTIKLWEERTLGVEARRVPWRDADVGARGLVRTDDDRVVAVHEAGSHAVTLFDRAGGGVLYRVPDARSLPWWERAAPLRPALFWALSGPDRHLVHAGAVGDRARGGALLAGAGGSGKTTVALAALAAGMRYVSDDYLLLHCAPRPVAWNLFGTAKLDDGHLMRFPELAAAARSPQPEPEEKAVLNVAEQLPDALAESLPIHAVIVPRIRGGRAALRRTSAAEALLALAPSTAFQMPFDGGAVVRSLAAVVRAVPCYALDVGDRPAELAAAVDRALEEASEIRARGAKESEDGARRERPREDRARRGEIGENPAPGEETGEDGARRERTREDNARREEIGENHAPGEEAGKNRARGELVEEGQR